MGAALSRSQSLGEGDTACEAGSLRGSRMKKWYSYSQANASIFQILFIEYLCRRANILRFAGLCSITPISRFTALMGDGKYLRALDFINFVHDRVRKTINVVDAQTSFAVWARC